MIRLFIPVVAFLAMMITLQACKDETHSPKEIEVRGLFSLTGNWSTLGLTSQAALDLAADDINDYLDNKDANFRLAVSVSDTKLETELAKSFFTDAKDDKISFIIGPQSSAEVAALKPMSDAAEMIVISQSSTAGSLAIDDNIFRFCPSDKIEGAAMANTIYKSGFRGLVTVARDDAGNKGLQTSTGEAFVNKGGELIEIEPYSTTLTDYSTVVTSLKNAVNNFLLHHGINEIGIYLASFDEGIEVMKVAAADSLLSSVKWFGADGVALSTAFLNDTTVAKFVIRTSFFAPSFGLPAATEAEWKPIAATIKARTGIDPDAFALATYDAMWTIAYTIEANNGDTDDFATLKTLFVEQANEYHGIVGSEMLDAAGDRATGTFDYFSIVKEGNTYVWVLVGKSDG